MKRINGVPTIDHQIPICVKVDPPRSAYDSQPRFLGLFILILGVPLRPSTCLCSFLHVVQWTAALIVDVIKRIRIFMSKTFLFMLTISTIIFQLMSKKL